MLVVYGIREVLLHLRIRSCLAMLLPAASCFRGKETTSNECLGGAQNRDKREIRMQQFVLDSLSRKRGNL